MHAHTSKDFRIYLLVTILMAGIFGIDLVTRRGVAEWVFYIIPTALCLLQSQPTVPVLVTAVGSALMVLGFFESPTGVDPTMAAVNRAIGMATLWGAAALVRQVLITRQHLRHMAWLQQGQTQLSQSMLGELDLDQLGSNALGELARYVGASVGALYRTDGKQLLRTAGFALENSRARDSIEWGHGLVGQVARDGQALVISDLADDYMAITSATGQARPRKLLVAPVMADGVLAGVVELGFTSATELVAERELIQRVAEALGIGMRSALYRQQLLALLEKTQHQSEELQAQQEELRVSNEELEEQSRILRESQGRLEQQHAELEQTNVQLEEQAQQLEIQKSDLVIAQRTLQGNATELARSNRYKSEFLANMSHELRTPLNSSLILSKLLSDNKSANLTDEQVRHASTIHASNNDLLNLINDILDLSKIESGHLDIAPRQESVRHILDLVKPTFDPVAQQKGVAFTVDMAADTPSSLTTDLQRLQQILKNLLSNAFKFTDSGEVALRAERSANGNLSFVVRDTGVGIAPHQQAIIFEAFRQADGTTSRKYGGTGLGLSISRELARLLGGVIHVDSSLGQGSTFTLELPLQFAPQEAAAATVQPSPTLAKPNADHSVAHTELLQGSPQELPQESPHAESHWHIDDDRQQFTRSDRLILVVEDDRRFAQILYELAHELDFDCVHASSALDGLALARDLKPNGILLDIGLPDQSGLSVLERLKRDPSTRHIPIHIVSVSDNIQIALELGAVGYVLKPVAREQLAQAIGKLEDQLRSRVRRVLIVEDDDTLRENISLLLKGEDIDIVAVGTAAQALQNLSETTFDCMVMDLMLPDTSGYALLESMATKEKYSFPPVIVYTGRALSRAEEEQLRRYSKSIIIKGAKSPERLLDEVSLFLHRVESSLPPDKQQLLRQARQRDMVFEQRRILLVEDDIRNIYALSAIFESLGVRLEISRNGKEAVARLSRDNDIDLVLMDVMMPEMDGLTATREIRKNPALAKLPIIALTAKAMADDRQNCLDAGANDYLAKPVDVDKLVSLCRVWLPK